MLDAGNDRKVYVIALESSYNYPFNQVWFLEFFFCISILAVIVQIASPSILNVINTHPYWFDTFLPLPNLNLFYKLKPN